MRKIMMMRMRMRFIRMLRTIMTIIINFDWKISGARKKNLFFSTMIPPPLHWEPLWSALSAHFTYTVLYFNTCTYTVLSWHWTYQVKLTIQCSRMQSKWGGGGQVGYKSFQLCSFSWNPCVNIMIVIFIMESKYEHHPYQNGQEPCCVTIIQQKCS